MKIISRLLKRAGLFVFLLTMAATGLLAQNPTYLCELRNDYQVSGTVFEFDVYLLRTGTTAFEYSSMQFGINIDAGARNGGTITVSLVPGSSQLNASQIPAAGKFSFNAAKNCIIMTATPGPGYGLGTIISPASPGTRIGRIRLTNTVNFGMVQPNLAWSWSATTGYPTKVNAYVGINSVEVTVQASHTVTNLANPYLNKATTAFNVTGTGSYCTGASGLSVGLDGSETGVTYYLVKNVTDTIATLAGTGSALNFGLRLSGYYTVAAGRNATFKTGTMSGSAVITESPLPAAAGTITGSTDVTQNETGVVYTVPSIANATGYTWSLPTGASITSGDNTNSITVSFSSTAVSGIITVIGTNTCGNGVISPSLNVTVHSGAPLAVTGYVTNPSCNGSGNGAIILSVSGGTTPYTYAWSNAATTSSLTGIYAGLYSVTVTDAALAAVTGSWMVSQPSAISLFGSVTNITCFGQSNGAISTTTLGGTLPYTYLWSNGSTASSATGLTAGMYSVTVTDANGCTTFSMMGISQPPALMFSATVTNVSCNGSANGSIAGLATGGTAPYTWLWSNSATTSTITGLMPGIYNVTITDANGCTALGQRVITEPSELALSGSAVNVTCFGQNNGSISLTPSGGTAPYTYLWSNGGTTSTITGLSAGMYHVTVTDANGCFTFSLMGISQPSALQFSAIATNVSCFGLNNGSIAGSASGGTAPYTYLWSTSETTSGISGLAAGPYLVTVTDANGCTTMGQWVISEPAALNVSGTAENVSCFGQNNGSISLTPSGGTAPYTYLWSNGGTTGTITGLAAGIYHVTVTDVNGCIALSIMGVSEPSALMFSAVVANVTCFGANNGSITVSVSGGTAPYTYLWSNGGTTGTITGLSAGMYNVTVTDANGCTVPGQRVITEPSALMFSATATNVTCFGGNNGSIAGSASGGTAPYGYLWSNGATTGTITGLAAGTYSVTVTDANGCTELAVRGISQPSAISLSLTTTPASCPTAAEGSVSLGISGGTPGYTYLWSTGATTQNITGLLPGNYFVTVTDNALCTKTGSTMVGELSPVCANISIAGDVTTTVCFNATNTITVAGGGTLFTVKATDGHATLIAGHNIKLEPGTHVEHGAYMHGYISTNYCINQTAPIVASTTGQDETPISLEQTFFTLYPNPTTGNFTLVQKGDKLYGHVNVAVFNMRGEKVMTDQMIGEKKHEFLFSEIPVGLYFVKIVADDYVETVKLIKTR